MARCIVFCAGGFQGLDKPLLPDSHVQPLGCKPDHIIGDFDSLGFVPEGAQVFPIEKDDTDAMLAVRHGLSLGFKEFVFYGALEGERLDHTISNYQTLLYLASHGAHGTLVGEKQSVTTVSDIMEFPAGICGTLSVFAMGGTAGA